MKRYITKLLNMMGLYTKEQYTVERDKVRFWMLAYKKAMEMVPEK